MLKILTFPNDILKQKSVAIEKVTPDIIQLAQEMYVTMCESNGVGISAPQIGQNIRLIIIEDNGQPLIMLNPHVLKASPQTSKDPEGCLSFPDKFVEINRPIEVTVKYRNIKNKMEYRVLTGLQARACLHEIDHLNAKLLSDYDHNII